MVIENFPEFTWRYASNISTPTIQVWLAGASGDYEKGKRYENVEPSKYSSEEAITQLVLDSFPEGIAVSVSLHEKGKLLLGEQNVLGSRVLGDLGCIYFMTPEGKPAPVPSMQTLSLASMLGDNY